MSTYGYLLSAQSKGKNFFVLGNEAITRSLLENNVKFASTYPGTPSSEIGEILFSIADKIPLNFQFCVNEKVALEMAYGAALSGKRSFVFMKHVGMNVASDPLMTMAYAGIVAGMVIMTADDPSMHSSQNEQDNRYYSLISHLPLVEPSNPQEALDFIGKSYEISEKYGVPVIFRTTTRVSHMRANVTFGNLSENETGSGHYSRDNKLHVCIPGNSYVAKNKITERDMALSKESDSSSLNRIEENNSKNGIITSGAAFNYIKDVQVEDGINMDILKIGFSNPPPKHLIEEFLRSHKSIMVIEELEPFMESVVRSIANLSGIECTIHGKLDGRVPMNYEFNPDVIRNILKGSERDGKNIFKVEAKNLPGRPPVLCPGCPHRATYFAIKRALKMANIREPIFSSDIGCYSLGAFEPFEEADTLISMGSSVGIANGFAMNTDQKVVAFIGDSTFFHSGIPAIVDAYRKNLNMVIVIMDNETTAMTGQEPDPGVEFFDGRIMEKKVPIENVLKGIGLTSVEIVDPYDLKETLIAMSGAIRNKGLSVIISRRECAIIRDRAMRQNKVEMVAVVDQDKCEKCMNCVENFSCPAIYLEGGNISIDPVQCDGCGVCTEPYVCPFKAIRVVQ
ncbi:MAG: indolepyruvate ferredoxin oxidoreductase subunit alpha [Cuniculiplasma sp.]